VRLTVGPSETVDLQSPVERLLKELEVILVLQIQLGGLVRFVVRSNREGGPQVLSSGDEDSADPRLGAVAQDTDRAEKVFPVLSEQGLVSSYGHIARAI
jgi:hypothetical protein